jgi:4-hydroxybenzoate polyprenyltransferase
MLALAPSKSHLRTLLILGRVSNLPTVWSNCFAGWLLAGGGTPGRFALLCLGATFLYLGGMYLNDAFDAQFDRQHRRERPIPSGSITARAVWQWGFIWLVLGCLSLGLLGTASAILGISLALTIFIYDAIHKIFAFSPIFMAVCRFLLILVAASAGVGGVTGMSLWSALALASYVTGLTFLSQRESTKGALPHWPCLLLAAPIVLAIIINPNAYLVRAALLSAILLMWIIRCLRLSYWSGQPNVRRTIAGLLAGIILVDLLAIGPDPVNPILPFFSLFALSLLLQRFVPAT